MTHLEKYQGCINWRDKVSIMYLYYMDSPKRSVSQVALYFNVSTGLVSENLKLFKNLDKVSECKSRAGALSKLKD